MNTYICFFLMFIVVAFASLSMGRILYKCNCIKDNILLEFSFGLLALMGILQLLYFPLMVIRRTSIVPFVCLTISLFFIVIVSNMLYKKKDASIKRSILDSKKEIIISLFVFATFLIIYYFVEFPMKTDDLYFFVPYENKLATSNPIFSSNLMDDYQGYYIIVAIFIWIYRNLVSTGFVPEILSIGITTWVPAIIFYAYLVSTVMGIMRYFTDREEKEDKYKIIIITAALFFYLFSRYQYTQGPYYGNAFRYISIALIIYALFEKTTVKYRYSMLFKTLLFAGIVFQSTSGYFISMMTLYAFFLYMAYRKETGYINAVSIMALPVIEMMIFIQPSIAKYLVGLYIIIIIINLLKLNMKIELLINKHYKWILFGIPIILAIICHLPFYDNKKTYMLGYTISVGFNFFQNHSYDGLFNLLQFDFSSLNNSLNTIFCLIFWFSFAITLGSEIKKKEVSFISFQTSIVLLTFFNPLTALIVVDYLTGGVYYRICDTFFNVFMFYYFTINALKLMDKRVSVLFILILTLCSAQMIPHNLTWDTMSFDNEYHYNHLYHTTTDEIEVLNKLIKEYLIYDDPSVTTVIASQIYSPDAISDWDFINVIPNVADLNCIEAEKADSPSCLFYRQTYRYFPGATKVDRGDLTQLCPYLYKSNVKYIIIDGQYNNDMEDGIGFCAELLFQMYNYRVFRMYGQ